MINLPTSTYLILSIATGRFPVITAIIFGNLVVIQYIVFIFLHVMAAAYSNQIHKCRKRLFHYHAMNNLEISTRNRFKLSLYLTKFSTSKKYGISYASYGLMTFASFFKVCILKISKIFLQIIFI